MTNPSAPIYYARIIKLDSTYVGGNVESSYAIPGDPLPVSGSIEFRETVSVPGQSDIGDFVIPLREIDTDSALRQLYNQIDYEQRVEIYDNFEMLGNPVFSGVVKQLPADLQKMEVRGVGILGRLETQRTRRYERVSDNAAESIKAMLKTYLPILTDDFNRAAFGADWAFTGTGAGWSLVNGCVSRTGIAGGRLVTAAAYGFSAWSNSRVSFDFYFPSTSATQSSITIDFGGAFPTSQFTILHPSFFPDTVDYYIDTEDAAYYRNVLLYDDQWNHADIYLVTDGASTTTYATLVINGNEIMVHPFTNAGAASQIEFDILQAGANPILLDNFVFAIKWDAMLPGVFDVCTTAIDQVFNRINQREVIDWIVNYLGWEYRVNAGAGAGNDTLDAGVFVGRDLTDLVLEEGKNIEGLVLNRGADSLATWATVQGRASNEFVANGFVSVDITAIDTYGIIETDVTDEQVIDSETAKIVGDAHLAKVTDGGVSMSGRIVDESWLLMQDPKIGYAVIGDSVIGGRGRLRPGDLVTVKSPRLGIDGEHRIVAFTRRSGDAAIDVTFDKFRWDRKTEEQRTKRDLHAKLRSFYQATNSAPCRLIFAGASTLTFNPTLRGYIETSVIDVCTDVWGGFTVTTLEIDGVDVTAALGGPWGANFHVDTTAYLYLSGEHSIALTTDGAVTLDIAVVTRLLG